MCGLKDLPREEKLVLANEILNSTEHKQAICNKILGCTFKDVERAMMGIIDDRNVTEAQKERLELEELAPDKFDPEIAFIVNKPIPAIPAKEIRYTTYTKEQVAWLMAASKAPPVQEEVEPSYDYGSLPRERVEELVREHYEYKQREKQKKQETDQWDSLMKAAQPAISKKPGKSTKT